MLWVFLWQCFWLPVLCFSSIWRFFSSMACTVYSPQYCANMYAVLVPSKRRLYRWPLYKDLQHVLQLQLLSAIDVMCLSIKCSCVIYCIKCISFVCISSVCFKGEGVFSAILRNRHASFPRSMPSSSDMDSAGYLGKNISQKFYLWKLAVLPSL